MKRISKEFNPENKRSVKNLHDVLDFLLDKDVYKTEKARKTVGKKTQEALKEVVSDVEVPQSGKLEPNVIQKINEAFIDKKYSINEHIHELHHRLKVLKRKNFIKEELSEREVTDEQIGDSTRKFITAFQKKYKLQETGAMNPETDERLESVITSIAGSKPRPKKKLKVDKPSKLNRTVRFLRLNMTNEKVQDLQKGLSWLGYKIHKDEFDAKTFGKTTRDAVLKFQESNKLHINGEVDSPTSNLLNKKLAAANPDVLRKKNYRVRGSIRNEVWEGKGGVKVQVYEKGLRGSDNLLGERTTFQNGFFDIIYNPPVDPSTKKPKSTYHLLVKVLDENENEIHTKTYKNASQVLWANYTEGEDRYKGASEFEAMVKKISGPLGSAGLDIKDIEQSDSQEDISQLTLETKILPEEIMKLSLSHRISDTVGNSSLPPEVFYAFLKQNLPPEMPGDLFPDEPDEWEDWTPRLVEQLTNGIVFLEPEIQKSTLNNTLEQNIVPRQLKIKMDEAMQALQMLRTEFTLQKPLLVGDGNLGMLLDTSSVKEEQYQTVANTFISNQGLSQNFWDELDEAGELDEAELADFKQTVDLGFISRNHQPAIQLMKSKIGDASEARYTSSRDFAKLSQSEWVDLIANVEGVVPENSDGANAEERNNIYAATLKGNSERLFPGVSLVAEVGRNSEHGLTHVLEVERFMDDNTTFDLGKDDVTKINIDSGNTLSDEALLEAKVLQRVHRIAPSSLAGAALLNEKLHSSIQIYFKGEDRLTELMVDRDIAKSDAQRIYNLAEHQYANVLARITQFRFDFFKVNPVAVPDFTYSDEEIEDFRDNLPNLEVLFGSLDFCECKHCSSMYSPAAYLTDLLRFLGEKDAETSGDSVRDVLFGRRPDIGNIKLNCDNTNTPMLYIDLVNEILENAIPPANSNFEYNTTLSAAELQSVPEHIRPEAYSTLKDSTRPINYAFNLWQEETRMFLEHLGVPRYKLMETWQDESDSANKIPKEVDIAAEFFGISAEEQQIIVPASSEATTAKQDEYWDFDSTQTSIPVSLFMEKSDITYHQVLEFLQCRYVNPEDGQSVVIRPVDDCDIDVQLLNNLNQEKLDRMHRFLRLWRRTGWEMWELDLLIRSPKIGNGAIDEDCLVALKRYKELQYRLSVSVEELLSFYDEINTEMRATADESGREINPMYHRLFLNVAVSNPIDTNFELPLGGGETLSYYTTTILSALAIRDEDFNLLSSKTDGQLTVESLSILYRHVSLAKKLRLSIKNLLLLLGITEITDPFESLKQTAELLKYHQAIKASGFSLIELNYVLNYAPDSPAGLREEVLVQYIEVLRTSLDNLNDEINGGNELPRERTEKHLSKISEFNNQDTLTKALNLIEGEWDGTNAERETFIDDHFGTFIPADANPAAMLSEESFYDGDPLTEAEENAIVERYAYVLDHLRPFLSTNLIKEHIASNLDMDNQQADVLLTKLSLPKAPPTLLQYLQDKKLIEQDTDGNFVHEINNTNYSELFRVYRLLHKVSIIINKLRLKPHEMQWFIDHNSEIEILEFQALPVDGPPSDSLFGNWYSLWRIIEFKRKYPEPEEVSFYDILEMGIDNTSNVTELLADLAVLTQWDEKNLVAIHQGLNLQHSGSDLDYARPDTYHHLQICVGQMGRTGVDAETMFNWATWSDETRQQSIATATRQAAKSKYETDEWLDKVKPIEDELREKKRDALVAYLLDDNPDLDDAGDLFNYFLIDVKMNACQLTSRLKQAISSVQLFVQRCFLNLESEHVQVPKDDPDLKNSWKQWKWMKNYRIWEANRKVFFYPENWIEPELRDDKSPFFKELENDIQQNEVTHENVEEAFLNYLQKVDEVANLDVIGIYHDFHSDGEELVHLIGRTKSIPHIYYHRTYSMDYFTWSAWEKLDIDITGDHAIPVVYNRKLHLFWLVFNERPVKLKKIPGAQPSEGATEDNPEPPKILEIQLAWSVKKHNGWTPKVLSEKKMIHPWQRPHFSYHIKPRYKAADNTMWVDLYISTSEEFNNTLFLDQHSPDYSKSRKTRHWYNQTYRPWHSSSFVFNGNVQKLKLRGLMGHYYVPGEDKKIMISSYRYVHENFGDEGRALEEISDLEKGGRLVQPAGMHYRYNALTNNRRHFVNTTNLNVVPTGFGTKPLLTGAITPFEAVIPMQSLNYRPFVYQDNKRAFFVKPEWKQRLIDYHTKESVRQHVFYPFYHPYTDLFIRELNRSGIDGLLTRKIQTHPESYHPRNTFDFNSDYNPVSPNEADESAKKDVVDFSLGGGLFNL